MMKQCILAGLVLASICVSSTWAWGGLFNRFNPSLMNDMYGSSYGKELYKAAETRPSAQMNNLAELLEEELEAEAQDPCNGKTCSANEHCCEGHVCVDTDDTMGTCLPVYGKKQGEHCSRDTDCDSGFLCIDSGYGRSCQTPVPGDKGLGEDCRTSSDCNISKGLCCKLHRRAKSQPKKICSYFTDPLMCIGQVAAGQVQTAIEHTAGEKRLSGHPDDFLRMK